MRGIDDIDRTIIGLLLENARRPYSDIAGHVELSAPAVADRIERLQELGVIRQFTVDLDHAKLQDGLDVLVDLSVEPGATGEIADVIGDLDSVTHRYVTADAHIVVHATLDSAGIDGLLSTVDTDRIRDITVRLLSSTTWTPQIGEAELAVDCDECGNAVTSEGETAVIGGAQYHFCCGSCLGRFEDRFDRLRDGM